MVWEEAGCGGFVQEVVRLVSALGVPRPMAEKADHQGQEAWKKGGLLAALQAEGLWRGEEGVFADEMRLGLLRQERQV